MRIANFRTLGDSVIGHESRATSFLTANPDTRENTSYGALAGFQLVNETKRLRSVELPQRVHVDIRPELVYTYVGCLPEETTSERTSCKVLWTCLFFELLCWDLTTGKVSLG